MRHIGILKAWVEGKKVQVRDDDEWNDLPPHEETQLSPAFLDDWEYRIKPGNKKFRVAQTSDGLNAVTKEEYASWLSEKPCFKRWLTDWIEYEE